MDPMARIRAEEGFRGMPYDDHLGNPTIGYGTLLPITEEEAEMLARHRLAAAGKELQALLRRLQIADLPAPVLEVLTDMSFQLGVPRLAKFERMLRACKERKWKLMAAELMDSRYAHQVPNRAKRNQDILLDV